MRFQRINRWPKPLTDSLLWLSKHTANTALYGIKPIYLSNRGASLRCCANIILTHYLDKRFWSSKYILELRKVTPHIMREITNKMHWLFLWLIY
jgi:hypothetical protein